MTDETKPQKDDGKAAKDTKPQKDDGLVEVTKADETLRVHPSCVAAHVAAGWKAA
jgi:hypothetical protein